MLGVYYLFNRYRKVTYFEPLREYVLTNRHRTETEQFRSYSFWLGRDADQN